MEFPALGPARRLSIRARTVRRALVTSVRTPDPCTHRRFRDEVLPDVVSRDQWLEARRPCWRAGEGVHSAPTTARLPTGRMLPMVKVDKASTSSRPGRAVTPWPSCSAASAADRPITLFSAPGTVAKPCPLSPGRAHRRASPRACSEATLLPGTPPFVAGPPAPRTTRIAADGEGARLTVARWYSHPPATFNLTNYPGQPGRRTRARPDTNYRGRTEPARRRPPPPRCPATTASWRRGDEIFHPLFGLLPRHNRIRREPPYTYLDRRPLGAMRLGGKPKGRVATRSAAANPTFSPADCLR